MSIASRTASRLGYPLVIAHRGHSAAAPENSLKALACAVAARADMVECDVRLAADDVPVVAHDPDLLRLAGRMIKVAEAPAAVLEAVASDAGASVVPLARLMAATMGCVPLMLDIKTCDPRALDAVADAAVEARFREENIVLGLRVPELAAAARVRMPNATVLALHGPSAPVDEFLQAGVRLVRLWESAAGVHEIAALAERGCAVWVTTGGAGTGRAVGDACAESLASLSEVGASGLLVNDPDLARSVLDRVAAFA